MAAVPTRIATDAGNSSHALAVQPSCLSSSTTPMTHNRYTIAMGMSTFHASPISWSKRKRGIVQRISMYRKMNALILSANTSTFRNHGDHGSAISGKCQPPKNRIAIRKLVVTMCVYSPR